MEQIFVTALISVFYDWVSVSQKGVTSLRYWNCVVEGPWGLMFWKM